MEVVLFYMFTTLCLFSGVIVITSKNPVHSVLYLVFAFCNASGLILLIEMEFIALIFLVVYVGAIAVLFLFVVMMLNIKEHPARRNSKFGLIGLIVLAEVFLVRYDLSGYSSYIGWVQTLDGVGGSNSNIEMLGQVLYTYYFYDFLVAGLILLVALVGAIVLTLQSKGMIVKRQEVSEQLSRDRKKALFLVDKIDKLK